MMVMVSMLLVAMVLNVLSLFRHVMYRWKLAVNAAPKSDRLRSQHDHVAGDELEPVHAIGRHAVWAHRVFEKEYCLHTFPACAVSWRAASQNASLAPHLAASQRELIRHMISDGSLKVSQMAKVAHWSERSVKAIRANVRCFGATNAPRNRGGRRRSLTPPMLDALREHLLENPGLYLDELAVFIHDEFDVLVTESTISRALKSIRWSKKKAREVAEQRNPDLRDHYVHTITPLDYDQLLFVGESGCDKRIGFRRTGWSPLGVTPVQVARLERGQRYQILPAYDHNGVYRTAPLPLAELVERALTPKSVKPAMRGLFCGERHFATCTWGEAAIARHCILIDPSKSHSCCAPP